MVDNLKFLIGTIVLAALVLLLGWREPLRYRFMSSQEIYELEHPPIPATPPPGEWMRDSSRRTLLDRPSYNERGYINDGIRRIPVDR